MEGDMMHRAESTSGNILIMTVMLVMMIAVMFVALSGFTSSQYRQGMIAAQNEAAFQIAETGLNFARWRLSHNPDDHSSVTREVKDPSKGVLGSYELTFVIPEGSTIVTITSVGQTATSPPRSVTLEATYGKPSLAKYLFVTNGDVWYKGNIDGEVHSNGGIRMDGTSNSVMTSAKATYTCTQVMGCQNQERPGVWGDGTDQSLWDFPVTPIDYNGLTLDLSNMKTIAQSAGTYMDASGAFGYHVVFNSNNTYSVYRVISKTSSIRSYAEDTDWEVTSHDIGSEVFVSSASVPENGVLFFEDTVWVQGDIRSRITVAAGKFPDDSSTNVDIIINGNISYGGVHDGTRLFGAVAQKNVLIPYSGAPDDLQLDGAFLAQHGRFGRRDYQSGDYKFRNSITVYGMVASNFTPVTSWANASSQILSGYLTASMSYDSHLLFDPPPYFPVGGGNQFLSWTKK